MKKLLLLVAVTLPLLAISASAGTITVYSDQNTIGVMSTSTNWLDYNDTANATGLAFLVAPGNYGTYTPVPPGAPSGTMVVNIPPTPLWDPSNNWYDGHSGFFEVTFTLPAGYGHASLQGAANVDDWGVAFLNGHPISTLIQVDQFGNVNGGINEFGNYAFSTSNQSYFVAGTNVLTISDANTGAGPSGAAFYANVNYGAVPEPGTLALLGSGLLAGAGFFRRKFMV